jgi:hypothetical protein
MHTDTLRPERAATVARPLTSNHRAIERLEDRVAPAYFSFVFGPIVTMSSDASGDQRLCFRSRRQRHRLGGIS